MEVDPSPVVRLVKFTGNGFPFVPAPTVTSTHGNKSALQPLGFLAVAYLMLQSSCCHI